MAVPARLGVQLERPMTRAAALALIVRLDINRALEAAGRAITATDAEHTNDLHRTTRPARKESA